ncbi:MAG: transcriptional repressor [Candidatus Omnitrophica bacterium]|nr:transcriptional repressor [Candidatus Omnitrophota bacterium]
MKKAIKLFIKFLRGKELKLTPQREKVINTFLDVQKHLTVEDLYNIIKKKEPSLGQATVFRTLKLLVEAGIAEEVDFGDKKTRYEVKYGHQHHDHIVCIKCGKFIEAMDPKIESLQKKLCEKFSFKPLRHKLKIFGICKQCQKKKRGEN